MFLGISREDARPMSAPSQTSWVDAAAGKNPMNGRRSYRPATLFSAFPEWSVTGRIARSECLQMGRRDHSTWPLDLRRNYRWSRL